MKPTAFEYYDPTTTRDALGLLASLGEDAKVLAGGQSLVPSMNFRLARPKYLVDLNRIDELSYLRLDQDVLCIGAMTRQRTLERSALVIDNWPLLTDGVAFIGHSQIRTRGTVGGSLAHADPAAELPALMSALDAELVVRDPHRERRLQSDEFFVSYLTTALRPQELLVEIRVPPLPPRTGWSFTEISRRHGDFALVGVAALVTLDEAGVVRRARLSFTGVGPAPVRALEAEQLLVDRKPDEHLLRQAAETAVGGLQPDSDLHASGAYRKEVGGVLARRALTRAAERATDSAAR